MTSDNCAVCGERTRYDGHEIEHSCAGGVPASNLPERDHGLVSISEMNRRIAEAVAAERTAVMGIVRSFEFDFERNISRSRACREILSKIRERESKC